MASYGMNDVKNGMKIIVDGYPCTIIDTEYVKPGKGQALAQKLSQAMREVHRAAASPDFMADEARAR